MLIPVNDFYLVKCYRKHTASIWNSIKYFDRFFHIAFFLNISLEVSDAHISWVYVQTDDMGPT